jgi:uncharacterized protein
MFFAGCAMACIYFSGLGSDPITTLIDGITFSLKVREGLATTIVNIIFFLFMIVFNRSSLGGATIISILFLGVFMDGSLLFLKYLLPFEIPFLGILFLSTFGSSLLGFAIGFYLSFDFGSTPPDSVPLWIWKKLKIRYRYCAWIFYSIGLIFGVLLGGTVGIGTIISLVIVGPIADFTMQMMIKNRKRSVTSYIS